MKRTYLYMGDKGIEAERTKERTSMTESQLVMLYRLAIAAMISAVCITALMMVGWIALVVEAFIGFFALAIWFGDRP